MKKILFLLLTSLGLFACSEPIDEQAIKGIEHADLYLNLKDKGFSDESNVTDLGVSHVNKKNSFDVDYVVTSYGTSSALYSYTANATAGYDISKNTEAPQLFAFVSSLPYEESNPEAIKQWVLKNYNTAKADTVVGSVQFELKAPTPFVRMLNVSKVKG